MKKQLGARFRGNKCVEGRENNAGVRGGEVQKREWPRMYVLYTLMVLKMLKPDWAVHTMTPGSCECQCSSLTSTIPWWMKSSWGGTSISAAPSSSSSASRSNAKSHMVSWSSAPAEVAWLGQCGPWYEVIALREGIECKPCVL